MPDRAAGAVVLDTDVASRAFKGLVAAPLAARFVGRQPVVTFVTVGELAQWVSLRNWGSRSRTSLEDWLSNKPVIAGSKTVARLWGDLSAAATKRGRPRPVNDTWIAACCLAYDLPLATMNLKDFADFADHDGLTLITR